MFGTPNMTQNKELLSLIGFKGRSKQELKFDPDPIDNKVAELQPWLLKSVKIYEKGVKGTTQSIVPVLHTYNKFLVS